VAPISLTGSCLAALPEARRRVRHRPSEPVAGRRRCASAFFSRPSLLVASRPAGGEEATRESCKAAVEQSAGATPRPTNGSSRGQAGVGQGKLKPGRRPSSARPSGSPATHVFTFPRAALAASHSSVPWRRVPSLPRPSAEARRGCPGRALRPALPRQPPIRRNRGARLSGDPRARGRSRTAREVLTPGDARRAPASKKHRRPLAAAPSAGCSRTSASGPPAGLSIGVSSPRTKVELWRDSIARRAAGTVWEALDRPKGSPSTLDAVGLDYATADPAAMRSFPGPWKLRSRSRRPRPESMRSAGECRPENPKDPGRSSRQRCGGQPRTPQRDARRSKRARSPGRRRRDGSEAEAVMCAWCRPRCARRSERAQEAWRAGNLRLPVGPRGGARPTEKDAAPRPGAPLVIPRPATHLAYFEEHTKTGVCFSNLRGGAKHPVRSMLRPVREWVCGRRILSTTGPGAPRSSAHAAGHGGWTVRRRRQT
jgi:hypothetical protein